MPYVCGVAFAPTLMNIQNEQKKFGTGGQTMRKQELKFMNELLVKLMVAVDDKLFLLNVLAGVSYDIASLEKKWSNKT